MAVVAGGTLILLYDMRWVDPAITIGIALYVLYLALTEIGAPIRTLMLGSPPDIDGLGVIAAVERIDGVSDLHHVHLWQMQEHQAALDAHVVLATDAWSRLPEVKATIKALVKERFGISHSTLEFEQADDAHGNPSVFGHGDKATAESQRE